MEKSDIVNKNKITITDIARISGFSKSTVSRVLRNSNKVDDATRKKIMNVIDQLNYKPSEIARNLVKGSTNIISLIVGDISNPYYVDTAKIIQVLMHKAGYMVVLCNSDFDHIIEDEYLDAVLKNNFAGVFMISATGSKNKLEEIINKGIPVLTINRYLPGLNTSSVLIDDYYGVQLATRHLIELGHKRIALLNAPKGSTPALNAINGFTDILKSYGISSKEGDVTEVELIRKNGYDFGIYLLNTDVTAVVCLNTATALGVIDAYRHNGKSVPKDLSVVGYDISSQLQDSIIKLTTVGVPQDHIGTRAVEIMLSLLNKQNTVPDFCERVILEPKLIIGESTMRIN